MKTKNKFLVGWVVLLVCTIASVVGLQGCGKKDGFAGVACNMDATFTTVDDFQSSDTNTYATAATVDRSGNVFVAGYVFESSTLKWIVRKGTGRGAAWTTVDDKYQLASSHSRPSAAGTDSAGNVYIGGGGQEGSNFVWLIKKSSDAGASWTRVDTAAGNGDVAGFANDLGGNIFAVGSQGHWSTRKSSDSGVTWTSSELLTTGSDDAHGIARDPVSNAYYAVGGDNDGGSSTFWRVRKFDGTTWSQVDSFQLVDGKTSQANAVAVTTAGAIFVVGTGTDANNDTRWVVRKSTDGGATFTTVDNYVLKEGDDATAKAVGIDAFGAVYVAGYADGGSSAIEHWIVRKSADGTTFTTVDDYQLKDNATAQAHGFVRSHNGDLYVVGLAADATPESHWITRKLGCN